MEFDSYRMRMFTSSMKAVRTLPKGSAHRGQLPRGCALCQQGAKMVLLVTGKCARKCSYCPLSQEKRNRDVFFANERRISEVTEAVDEGRLMDALGTGVTGGDPMVAIDRTTDSIRALKREFGDQHHIHLYTSTTDVKKIDKAARAGLDEIRFHPPVSMWTKLEKSDFSNAIRASMRRGMDTGIEIPVIPGKGSETVAVISFADSAGMDFVNLNELEFSETNWRALRSRGFAVKDDISSGVMGSQKLARSLLRLDADVPIHYCSAAFKDGVQLRRRIVRRAKNVKKPYELLSRDGTFVKGIIETAHPAATAAWLMRGFDIPGKYLRNNPEKGRLEVAPWILEEIAEKIDEPSFIIEEYPTADRLEVERRPLRRR